MAPGEHFGNSDFVVVANRLPVDLERLPDGTTS
jgi:trehalose 6-phosphate synthase